MRTYNQQPKEKPKYLPPQGMNLTYLQPKLKIGKPGDKYEREADRVAEEVMRMGGDHTVLSTPGNPLQRKCTCDSNHRECEECRKKRTILRRKAMDNTVDDTVPPIVHEVLRSPGKSLDSDTRNFMESRFGYDFSSVRVHTSTKAAKSAETLNAQAYTVGNILVFNYNRYNPQNIKGKKLIAHELTHTVQQGKLAPIKSRSYFHELQSIRRMPDVGLIVHEITRNRGYLDDPSEDGTGIVSWPLSFSVPAPLEAEADVEVTGRADDPCSNYDVGWLQTVHSQWVHIYYWGRNAGDGSTIIRYHVPLPIRDGESGTFWYSSTSHENPSSCNTRISPRMDDYPTIFYLPKTHYNTFTDKNNYLTGVRRGIHFVTTLVAVRGNNFRPLRFFYWNYQMSINFRPNYNSITDPWPYTWNINRANLGRIHTGGSNSVPIFTTATTSYNHSLTRNVTERY